MSKWASKRLNELVDRPISGTRPAGGVDNKSDGIPSLGGENILSNGGVTFENLNRVPIEYFGRMPRGHLRALDVLINKDGAQTGKVGIYKGDFSEACINEHLFILRGKDGSLDQKFLYYSILFPLTQSKIARRITGSAQPGLNSGFVNAVDISIPGKIQEQSQIAEILSTVDEAIEQTEALIEKYQKIKAGLLHDLFTRGVTPDGKLRPPRTQAPHLYKKSPLGWIPKEWGEHSLGSLSNLITSGSRGWADYYSEKGALFIRIGNLTREHINFCWDDMVRVFLPPFTEGQRTAVMPNDILISITADLGIIAVADESLGEAYVNQHIALVRLKDCLISRFVGNFLSTSAVQSQFIKLNDSGAKAGLNLPSVRKILVVLPGDESETRKMASLLDACDRCIRNFKIELVKYNQQKQGLMHDLLTGRVLVKVPELVSA